jgi:hypothetical protein
MAKPSGACSHVDALMGYFYLLLPWAETDNGTLFALLHICTQEAPDVAGSWSTVARLKETPITTATASTKVPCLLHFHFVVILSYTIKDVYLSPLCTARLSN